MINSIITRIQNIITDYYVSEGYSGFTVVNTLENKQSIGTDELPLFLVYDLGATFTVNNADELVINRQFNIEFFHSLATDDQIVNRDNVAEARSMTELLPVMLYKYKRLSLNDAGLDNVNGVLIPNDNGIGKGGFRNQSFYGTEITFNVVYTIRITS